MTTADLDDAFGRWRSALLDVVKSPDNVMAWQDRRYRFAFQLGVLLTSAAPDGPPIATTSSTACMSLAENCRT